MGTTIYKQLAAQQDLLLGRGQTQQLRNGTWVSVDKLALVMPVASIGDLASIDTTKYLTAIVEAPGYGGVFMYDSSLAAQNNKGTVIDGWVRQYEGNVQAKWFGVVPDTAEVFKEKLQAAFDVAQSEKKVLEFLGGTFLIKEVNIKATMQGISGKTELKFYSNAVDGAGKGLRGASADIEGITIADIIFDGNVSADPVWDTTNYDSFLGSQALYLHYPSKVRIVNCEFNNSNSSCLGLYGGRDIQIDNCRTNRARGNAGDGFMLYKCVNTNVVNCFAKDFTRIGFVAEGDGGTSLGSYDINFSNCRAENGHNNSAMYGGSEYNAGFWFENSTEIAASNIYSKDILGNSGFGVVLAGGTKSGEVSAKTNSFNINGLTTDNVRIGLRVNIGAGLTGRGTVVNLTNFSFHSTLNAGLSLNTNAGSSVLIFNGSKGYMELPTSTVGTPIDLIGAAGLTSSTIPEITLSDIVLHDTKAFVQTKNDISCYGNYDKRLVLRNIKQDNGTKVRMVLYGGTLNKTEFTFSDMSVYINDQNNTRRMTLNNCILNRLSNLATGSGVNGELVLNNCTNATVVGFSCNSIRGTLFSPASSALNVSLVAKKAKGFDVDLVIRGVVDSTSSTYGGAFSCVGLATSKIRLDGFLIYDDVATPNDSTTAVGVSGSVASKVFTNLFLDDTMPKPIKIEGTNYDVHSGSLRLPM